MAINRAPFNALVDDNGTGTTGSVWNKAAIAGVILDPADAAYVAQNPWANVAFSVANFWPGVTAGQVAANHYVVVGKVLLWTIQIAGAPAPGGPYLSFTAPVQPMIATGACFGNIYALDAGVVTPSLLFEGNAALLQALKSAGGNWAGPVNVAFTAIAALA